MLNREDLLQELELLPVWQLRNPVPKTAEEGELERTQLVVESAQLDASVKQTEGVPLTKPTFRLIMSDDGQWAFVLEATQNEEAEALLQNMLKAVSVKVSQDEAEANQSLLHQHVPKMIVVMGELEAQQLLSNQQPLEQLRGETRLYQNTPIVVTYSPSHLLAHWQDKAKAWEDLCLAKLTIANL